MYWWDWCAGGPEEPKSPHRRPVDRRPNCSLSNEDVEWMMTHPEVDHRECCCSFDCCKDSLKAQKDRVRGAENVAGLELGDREGVDYFAPGMRPPGLPASNGKVLNMEQYQRIHEAKSKRATDYLQHYKKCLTKIREASGPGEEMSNIEMWLIGREDRVLLRPAKQNEFLIGILDIETDREVRRQNADAAMAEDIRETLMKNGGNYAPAEGAEQAQIRRMRDDPSGRQRSQSPRVDTIQAGSSRRDRSGSRHRH